MKLTDEEKRNKVKEFEKAISNGATLIEAIDPMTKTAIGQYETKYRNEPDAKTPLDWLKSICFFSSIKKIEMVDFKYTF